MFQALVQNTITISIITLILYLLIAVALGWVIYGLRGYHHWLKRFHRYQFYVPQKKRTGSLDKQNYFDQGQGVDQEKVQSRPIEIPYSTKDDLKVVAGVDLPIETILNNQGIHTWKELSITPVGNLNTILERAEKPFHVHDAQSWPHQAYLADMAHWNELEKYKEFLFSEKK